MKSSRKLPHGFVCLSALAFGSVLQWPCASAGDWTGTVALTSDYRAHGLQRSAGHPAAQAQLGYVGEHGWSAGVWGSTVKLHSGPGPRRELDTCAAAYSQLSRDWRLSGQITHYEFFNDSPYLSYDYTELAGTVSLRDALSATVSIAPRYSFYSNGTLARGRKTVNWEIVGHRPLDRNVQLTGGVGHSDLQQLFGASYWYWSGGAELDFRRLRLAVSYVGTDSSAKYLFGRGLAGDAWIATLAYRLF